MSITNTPTETNSNNDVHPICQFASDPEKCAEFVETLEDVNSSMEFRGSLIARTEADRKAKSA